MKGKIVLAVGVLLILAMINWKVALGLIGIVVVATLLFGTIAALLSIKPAERTEQAEPPRLVEPKHVTNGGLGPDGKTVDDETHQRRLLANGLVLHEDQRDPAWKAALEAQDEPFRPLRSLRDEANHWLQVHHGRPGRLPNQVTMELEQLCAKLGLDSSMPVGTTMRTRMLAQELAHWLARTPIPGPDPRVMIELDRRFSLVTDCQHGHFAEHAIVSSDRDRVVRECRLCEPPTRWSERA